MTAKSTKAKDRIQVRMLFAEEGSYHSEVFSLPAEGLEGYGRIIDFLLEDESVLKECYLDLGRLCAAQIVPAGES